MTKDHTGSSHLRKRWLLPANLLHWTLPYNHVIRQTPRWNQGALSTSSLLSSAKTSNTKGRGRLSATSSTARLSLLSAISGEAEYTSLVVFEASLARRFKAPR